ncbi:hypothetical protein ABFX02_04G057700 [Erythranthe guttata]
MAAVAAENQDSMAKMPSVFMAGKIGGEVKTIKVKKSDANGAELLIVTPKAQGSYPVLLFCHGYSTQTTWYSHLLQHISSHGYIVVAPQIAFALALGHAPTSLKFKALFGLDPVSGPTPPTWVEPNILSYVPHSFKLSIPIGVIGTGLSNRTNNYVFPPLAPNGFNHSEFFNESRPPCCYFLAKDYGHCDFLNDSKTGLAGLVCRSGKGSKEKMRRGVGGIVVAFLNAYLGGGFEDLENIVAAPDIAPITLDPVIHIKE